MKAVPLLITVTIIHILETLNTLFKKAETLI